MANKYHSLDEAAKKINDMKFKGVTAETYIVNLDPFTEEQKAAIKKARQQLGTEK
jgi:hypothetical protein